MDFVGKVDFSNLKQRSPDFGRKTKFAVIGFSLFILLAMVVAIPEVGEIEVTNDESQQEDDGKPVLVISQTYQASILDMAFADFVGCDTPPDSDQEINCDVKWSSIMDFSSDSPEGNNTTTQQDLQDQLDEELGDLEGNVSPEDVN